MENIVLALSNFQTLIVSFGLILLVISVLAPITTNWFSINPPLKQKILIGFLGIVLVGIAIFTSMHKSQTILNFDYKTFPFSTALENMGVISGSQEATFCTLSRNYHNSQTVDCAISYDANNKEWKYQTGTGGANMCEVTCIWIKTK